MTAEHTSWSPEAAFSQPDPELVQAVDVVLLHCREQLLARIHNAQQLSETSVLAAGSSLDRIVTEAHAFLGHLKEELSAFGGDPNDLAASPETLDRPRSALQQGALVASIKTQHQAINAFLTETAGVLREQERFAQEAACQTRMIVAAGEEIEKLTHTTMALTTRIIALNESLHNGEAGDDDALPDEMEGFVDAARQTRDRIDELAGRMQSLLPVIVGQTESLQVSSAGFYEQHRRHAARVDSSIDALKTAVLRSMRTGDEHMKQILSLSQNILSNLQFQDPMIQDLQRIDAIMFNLQRDIGQIFGDTSEQPAPPAHARIGDDYASAEDEDSEIETGEVMLW